MAEKQLTSVTKLYKIYPKAKPGIFEVLDTEMTKENFTLIDKENFLAQAAHESNGFSTFVENLNYSADGLRRVFGKYFKNKDINYYARNPERIGSLVYANRMGNGDEQSKDGYRYRGRGIFQITGKNNYQRCTWHLKIDCIKNPEYLESIEGAAKSAIWFWKSNNLSGNMSNEDITKAINGGLNGLQDRINHLYAIRKFLRNPS